MTFMEQITNPQTMDSRSLFCPQHWRGRFQVFLTESLKEYQKINTMLIQFGNTG